MSSYAREIKAIVLFVAVCLAASQFWQGFDLQSCVTNVGAVDDAPSSRPRRSSSNDTVPRNDDVGGGGGGGGDASASSIMRRLSDSSTFLGAVEYLYGAYGSEIAAFRPQMWSWCTKTKSCKYTDFEAEMLYMLIREKKPRRVFEMAPNRGFSSHWILKALSENDDDDGTLHSVDIHNASVPFMFKAFKHRWTFQMGDFEDLLERGELDMSPFDFLFIDALHTEEFNRKYCEKLLHRHERKGTVVAIHDIVANKLGGGLESAMVYKYMAFANNIESVFTVSRFFMPTMFDPVPNATEEVHKIRAMHAIVPPCDGDKCKSKNALHDPLYFENNDAPTIFFELN